MPLLKSDAHNPFRTDTDMDPLPDSPPGPHQLLPIPQYVEKPIQGDFFIRDRSHGKFLGIFIQHKGRAQYVYYTPFAFLVESHTPCVFTEGLPE